MSTPRQKPIDFAAEGLCLASLSIPTAESGFIVMVGLPRDDLPVTSSLDELPHAADAGTSSEAEIDITSKD